MNQNGKGTGTTRRRFLKQASGGAMALTMSGLSMPAIAQSKNLTIIANENNDQVVAALKQIAADFELAHGASVTINRMDHEAHKTAIRNYLVAGAPDVCFWFSGNRMKTFIRRGLFEDISDLFAEEKYADVLGGVASAVTVNGKQYGLPLGGTLWGNFYLKDVFDEYNLVPPTNWDEMLDYAENAKAAGMTPLAIGTKELWPAAGYFDQLSLRIIGLENHLKLMDGEMSYLDPVLQPIFDHWEHLINTNFFLENHTSYGWQEAGALFGQKKCGMIQLGNFVQYALAEDQIQHLTYVPHPKIADIPRYEDFSVDTINIPTNAKHKELARDFLRFFYQPENLNAFLTPLATVPPRNDMPESDNRLLNAAVESLKTVAGTAQYYDRDTDPDMALEGLKGFQEFMVLPERRQQILERLEATRKRIFSA